MPDRLNQPSRDIFVQVPDRGRIWTSGDVVRGVVRVKPTSRPQKVSIVFRGRMKCAITRSNGQNSQTYKEKPEFFRKTLDLWSSSTLGQSYDIVTNGVTEDDRVEFPFEFTFPEHTEISLGDRWIPSPRFEYQSGGSLPPTYYRASRNEQLVEYFLEGRLYTGGMWQPTQEVRCPLLKYRPFPRIPDHIPMLPEVRTMYSRGILARTHRLHPDYDPDEGFRARLKHAWTKNEATTPHATFRISVACPSVVTNGQPVVLQFSLEHLERSKDVPDPPPVHLRRITVKLSSELFVRIPSRSFLGTRDMNDSHSDKYTLIDQEFNTGEGLVLYDGMTVSTRPFPVYIAPAFSTYGLALQHFMKVEIRGECAREKFQFTPVQGSVDVVHENTPPVYDHPPPSPKDGVGAEDAGEVPPPLDGDSVPPPYQVLGKN